MRILVYVHSLRFGGSQINAIDLAAAVRDLGHEVMTYAVPGPLRDRIAARGLPFVPAEDGIPRSPRAIRRLHAVARFERVELVHAYEYYPCFEALYGPHLLRGIPMVATVLGMAIPRFQPRWTPLVIGTAELAAEAETRWRAPVLLLEPPIDTEDDSPEVDPAAFRAEHRLDDGIPSVVLVSRLDRVMKSESIRAAIDAVGSLGRPTRLVLVGTGDAEEELRQRAKEVNRRLGRDAIRLVGPMLDPRPAYASADVVVGMGSSMLRGMAFAKPGLVVGERGFCEAVTPQTIDRFLAEGFYGFGDGSDAAPVLREHLDRLLADASLRRDLGAFGRDLVRRRFDLRIAAARLEGFYRRVVSEDVGRWGVVADSGRIGAQLGWEATKVIASRLGRRLRPAAPRVGVGS